MVFFFSTPRRHTKFALVSWARRCPQETALTEHKIFRGRWVDVSKAGVGNSRWVCQDIAWEKKDNEFFACTPSADTTRCLEAYAIFHGYNMMTADVSTAFLHAQENEKIAMHPPKEWADNHDPDWLWEMIGNIYGRRPAMKHWQTHSLLRLLRVLVAFVARQMRARTTIHFGRSLLCSMLMTSTWQAAMRT